MSVEIEGMRAIIDDFEKMFDDKKVEQALGKACALIEGAAKRKAPKGTGELRRSITSKVEKEGEDFVGIVFTPLEYAPYVEFGTGIFAEEGGRTDVPWSYQDDEGEWHTTSGMEHHPFMRPALYDNTKKIIKIVKEELADA